MLFLSNDPCSDTWEREHRDNARRLRSKLLELRGKVVAAIPEETSTVIQTARLAYIEMLNECWSRLNTALLRQAESV